MTIGSRIAVLALAGLVPLCGCARSLSNFIVQQRNHQGDLSFEHHNPADAAIAYKLALRVEPKNQHARTGLAAVQLQIAYGEYSKSHFADALQALALAAKYDPQGIRLAQLRSQVEQARIKQQIVLSNYPTYRETGLGLRKSYAELCKQSDAIVTTLQHFDYSFDSNQLTKAIAASVVLRADVGRLTARLTNYRQLVESGSPERSGTAPLAPAASLLPLP